MEDSEEDEFLSLSLSVAAAGRSERKNKGKKRHINTNNNNNANSIIISSPMRMMNNYYSSSSSYEGYEGKIFRLLQMREMMLRQENHHHHHHNRIRNKGVGSDENTNNSNNGLPLIHLLLTTATEVDERNMGAALENLTELYRTVSLTGDSVERVVAYFSDGLTARLLTKKSPFYEMLMEEPTHDEQFLAFTDLYRVSPYYQFAHFTANQAILEAFEQEEHRNNRALHVVDFDVSYGFQWPSLIQSLSDKATSSSNRISLRVTGFGNTLKELQETESRLVSFSKGFNNLVFEFQGLLNNSSRIINLKTLLENVKKNKKKNETVAVNLVCSYLKRSNSNSVMNNTLGFVHSLNPSIVVMVKQEGGSSRSVRTFLSRFSESLHYFAAMFDSLDDCLPLESTERLRIEKKLLGREIKGLMNCDVDGVDCPKYIHERMESHGFVGTKISSKSLIQAKLLLKMRTHYCPLQFEQEGGSSGGFRISERDQGRAISLAWQNRFLLTVSAWQPV